MRPPLLLALAVACFSSLPATAEAAPSPTMGRHASFLLEVTGESRIDWTYDIPTYRRNCYQMVASHHKGSDEWRVRMQAAARVTALDVGTMVLVSLDGLNPIRTHEIRVGGKWSRDTTGEDVTTPGDCGGSSETRRADRANCGTQLPEQTAALTFWKGQAIMRFRSPDNLPHQFERCRLLAPEGMLPGAFPDDDGLRMRFDRDRLFGREGVLRLKGSKEYRGRSSEYSSTSGKVSWTATLTRVVRSSPAVPRARSRRRSGRDRGRRR